MSSFTDNYNELNKLIGNLSEDNISLDERVGIYNLANKKIAQCEKKIDNFKIELESKSAKKIKKNDLDISLTSLLIKLDEDIMNLSDESNLDKAINNFRQIQIQIEIAKKILEKSNLEIKKI